MPKMLNSRPTVSGHKRKVAPITARVLMPIQVSRSVCLSDCLPQFVIDAQLGVAANAAMPGLAWANGILSCRQLGHVCDFHFN